MPVPCEAEAAEVVLREAQWIIAKANELVAAAAVIVAQQAYEECMMEEIEDDPLMMGESSPILGRDNPKETQEIKRLRNAAHDLCCMPPAERAQCVDRVRKMKSRITERSE